MQIENLSVSEDRRLIPIKGWDGVGKVITLFSNGLTRGALASHRITVDDMEEAHGPKGLALFLLDSLGVGKPSDFVSGLLNEAEASLKQGDEFKKEYDYDGVGPFHKTNVTFRRLSDDMYGIGLWAACVGDEPEIGLAEHLGIPRALEECMVKVETKPTLDRFEFDFEEIVRKLDSVLGTTSVRGEQIAQAMLREEDKSGAPLFFPLAEKDGFRVQIQPGEIQSRWKYSRNDKRDTWSVNGSVFSGEVYRYGRNETKKAAPTFFVIISSAEDRPMWWRKESMPMWLPEQQQKAIALANHIADTLK